MSWPPASLCGGDVRRLGAVPGIMVLKLQHPSSSQWSQEDPGALCGRFLPRAGRSDSPFGFFPPLHRMDLNPLWFGRRMRGDLLIWGCKGFPETRAAETCSLDENLWGKQGNCGSCYLKLVNIYSGKTESVSQYGKPWADLIWPESLTRHRHQSELCWFKSAEQWLYLEEYSNLKIKCLVFCFQVVVVFFSEVDCKWWGRNMSI